MTTRNTPLLSSNHFDPYGHIYSPSSWRGIHRGDGRGYTAPTRISAPALWASYLMCGDDSLFDDRPEERARIEDWLQIVRGEGELVGCSNHNFYGLYSWKSVGHREKIYTDLLEYHFREGKA